MAYPFVLDPSCGKGEFLLKSAKKMQEKGCRDVLSRLWAADFSGLNLLMTRKRLRNWAQDPNNNQQVFDFVNKIKYNSVEDLRRQLGGMKFDIVVGNPPYQDRVENSDSALWLKFVNLGMYAIKEDGRVSCITPTSWVGKQTKTKKADFSAFTDNHVELYKPLNDKDRSKYFGKVGSSFGYYILSKGKGPTNLVLSDNTIVQHQIVIGEPLPKELNQLSYSIHNKISKTNKFIFERYSNFHSQALKSKFLINDKETSEFLNKTYYSHNLIRYSSKKQNIFNDIKVMIPNVGVIANAWSDSNCNITEDVLCAIVKTKKQAENMVKILKSPLYRYIGAQYRSGRNLGMVVKFLPELDTSLSWTDEKIYKTFGLTPEEIAHVESTVKA